MFDIVGLGNALVDIEILLSEEELTTLEVVKNSMTLISVAERELVLKKLEHTDKKFSSGGAVCNTLCGIAKKSTERKSGFKVGMMGFVGNDFHGDKYLEDLKAVGVDFLGKRLEDKTGTCLVLITPDGNRTMLTTLGCASSLSEDTLLGLTNEASDSNIAMKHFLAESYLLFGEENIGKVREVFRKLKPTDTVTMLSDSDAFCVEQEKDIYQELFTQVDVFFSNGEQAKAMVQLARTDETSVEEIVKQWGDLGVPDERAPMMVVTDGENGAYLVNDRQVHVPAIATKVIDTTGAGDAFNAGVLSIYLTGKTQDLEAMGKLGAEMASKVVAQYGARW